MDEPSWSKEKSRLAIKLGMFFILINSKDLRTGAKQGVESVLSDSDLDQFIIAYHRHLGCWRKGVMQKILGKRQLLKDSFFIVMAVQFCSWPYDAFEVPNGLAAVVLLVLQRLLPELFALPLGFDLPVGMQTII